MRGGRSLVILLVVAAVLGGYLYYDSKHPVSNEKKQDKVFDNVAGEKIDQITVKSESGDRTTAKQGDAWQIVQPAPAPADEATISGITSSLGTLDIQHVVDDQPADLKQYGLDPAKIEIHFTAGGKEQTLLLGQKTPTGTDLYVKVPDKPRVFLVSSYLEATFNKNTFDLRDKTILKIDRDKVDHVEVHSPDRTLAFAKQGTDWRMTSPVDARADFGALEGLLGRLNTAAMKGIASEHPDNLSEYGLDKPDYTVTLGSGSSQAGLLFGKTSGEGAVYAKDLSRPMVFTVDATILDDLKKGPDDYRVKDLFDARSFNTTHIEIARGGQTLSFDKVNNAWKQTAPAGKTADTPKVDAMLNTLTGTRAASFVEKTDNTGLDKPDFTVMLKFEDGQKQEKVAFAKHGGDGFAQRDGDKGAAKLDTGAIDGIIKALDALK